MRAPGHPPQLLPAECGTFGGWQGLRSPVRASSVCPARVARTDSPPISDHRVPSFSDLFPPLAAPSTLTPGGDPGSPGQGEFSHVDLAVLFSDPPADGSAAPGPPDAALGPGILTVDMTPAGASLGGDLPAGQASFGPMDPLVFVAHSDVPPGPDSPLVLGTAAVGFQQGGLATDDLPAMGTGTLGCLVAVPVKSLDQDPQALTPSGPQGASSAPEPLVSVKMEPDSPPRAQPGWQQEPGEGALRPAESSPSEQRGPRRDAGLVAGTSGFYLVRGTLGSPAPSSAPAPPCGVLD